MDALLTLRNLLQAYQQEIDRLKKVALANAGQEANGYILRDTLAPLATFQGIARTIQELIQEIEKE